MAGTTTKKLTTVLYTKYVRNTKNNSPKNNKELFSAKSVLPLNQSAGKYWGASSRQISDNPAQIWQEKFHIIFWRIVLEVA
jgi:hypothetical protein